MPKETGSEQDFTRLPRSDIPPDYRCIYPQCQFQGKNELAFRGHMASAHRVKYERKEEMNDTKKMLAKWEKSKEDLLAMSEISQLASWHCAILAQHVVYGLPLGPLAKAAKHSADTINLVARSPAGQAYMASVAANLHDPIATTRNLLAAGSVSKLLDWEYAWQLAVEAKDYPAIHRMAKEIGLHQVLETQQKQGPTKIVLNLGMNDLAAPPQGGSKFRVIEADFEVTESAVEEPDGSV